MIHPSIVIVEANDKSPASNISDRHIDTNLRRVSPDTIEIRPEDYPNNDYDVVKATLSSGLSFHELVLTVWKTKDTVFSIDVEVAGPHLFKRIAAFSSKGPTNVLNMIV